MAAPLAGEVFPTSFLVSPLIGVCFAALLRCMISLWPYSGQADPPIHGDYEAQRHWMEITTALPFAQWYRFDLEYWGLDYPPLTAYVSWACGQLSSMVDPPSMIFGLSRGYETRSHKAFMRLTVLVLDLAVFFPAAAALAGRLIRMMRSLSRGAEASFVNAKNCEVSSAGTATFLMVILQPSLIVVDHGHFQYNSVCLGLAMGAAATLVSGGRRGELVGSVLFSLSLNFKQMALYYAPAFFFFLLASCVWGRSGGRVVGGGEGAQASPRYGTVVRRVIVLGLTVASTFAALWWPFCAYADSSVQGCVSSLGQVVLRLFPFSRGLFEDKVANVWFCLDVVLKLRRKLAVPHLAKLALFFTASLLMPVGAELLRPGRRLTARRLVLSLFNSSLAFFLCSFQVHEKSLLLPLCPLAFLWEDSPLFVTWLQIVGIFSMKPLLGREGLLVPCLVCTILYIVLSVVLSSFSSGAAGATRREASMIFPYGRLITQARLRVVVGLSVCGMVLLLALEGTVQPPESLPHLHPTLNALFSCGNLALAYILGVYWQWKQGDRVEVMQQHAREKKTR